MFGMTDGTKFLLWLLLLTSSPLCFGSELDIQCLMSVKQSVIDPNGIFQSWNFLHTTDGYICRFTGVECWHPAENRVLSLRFSNFGLQGPFPQGLQNCTSMTSLDLSSNKFSGPIPPDISRQIPFLDYLDLSYNSFSDNLLEGPIPNFSQNFSPSDFDGNQGLCGAPLDPCSRRRLPVRIRLHRINDESCIGGAAGFVAGFVVAFYFPHCFVFSERLRTYVFHVC